MQNNLLYIHLNQDRLAKVCFALRFPNILKFSYNSLKKPCIIGMRCVRDGSENPLCFFFKNIKIAAYSPTQSCEEERRRNLQGARPKNTYSINQIHKKSATLDFCQKERIYQTTNLKQTTN